MKAFMDKDFLLETETAKHLFHDYAENMPLVDYHCHISPREIYEDRRFNDLTEVWLGGRQSDGSYFGDHYKWRVMRSNGVSEEYITGDKPSWLRQASHARNGQRGVGLLRREAAHGSRPHRTRDHQKVECRHDRHHRRSH